MSDAITIEPGQLRENLFLISGPCVIEDLNLLKTVAEELKGIAQDLKITVVFKSSYDKANRTSLKGFRGPGLKEGVEMLQEIRESFKMPVLTDVHSVEEAEYAGKYLDVLQIPAFLCRQTDLVLAACETPAWVNIKKGQFLSPWDMAKVVEKAKSVKSDQLMLTERGTTFGYNMLVSDMRSIPVMKEQELPVVYDGTHSVQRPGGQGDKSGGDREYVPILSRAAIAAGADGLFWEAHPNPDSAPSDGPNMLVLSDVRPLLKKCLDIYRLVRESN